MSQKKSPIIRDFWHFLRLPLSDSAKRMQTKEKALILLRTLKHGAAGGNVRFAHPSFHSGPSFPGRPSPLRSDSGPRDPRVPVSLNDTHKKISPQRDLIFYGAAGGNRTHDPSLTKGVRYHYATAATH